MSEKSIVSPKISSNDKKAKKQQKQQTNPVGEKFMKLLTMFDKSLSNWKNCSLIGNTLLTQDILSKKKEILSSENASSEPFSLELQNSTEKAHKIVNDQMQLIQNLKNTVEKLEALNDLNNFMLNDSTLTENSSGLATSSHEAISHSAKIEVLKVLVRCYEEQTKLNRTVSENIGTASTLDQTVYYACIWTHQPAIGQECFIAERQLAFMVHV